MSNLRSVNTCCKDVIVSMNSLIIAYLYVRKIDMGGFVPCDSNEVVDMRSARIATQMTRQLIITYINSDDARSDLLHIVDAAEEQSNCIFYQGILSRHLATCRNSSCM